MFAILFVIICILIIVPAILTLVRSWMIVISGVIVAGIFLAYLVTQLPM